MRYFITFTCYGARLHATARVCTATNRDRWIGVTTWLGWKWKDEELRQALKYAIDEQGEPMAVLVVEEL